METVKPNYASSTISTGKVVTALLIPFLSLSNLNIPSITNPNIEKLNINATNSTGEGFVLKEDFDKYYQIYSFSKDLLHNMTISPLEFEEYFQENFWELLA
ncbi:TPA: hypothetical protein ACT9IY_002889 [Legionella pneumophila]|nr:hypothetical protein [Legionella pneumophila]HCZ0415268.1 hypothetical protein [Legionella pneumophila]HDE5451012.1 hypothetical protein [Legionella pneumophila]